MYAVCSRNQTVRQEKALKNKALKRNKSKRKSVKEEIMCKPSLSLIPIFVQVTKFLLIVIGSSYEFVITKVTNRWGWLFTTFPNGKTKGLIHYLYVVIILLCWSRGSSTTLITKSSSLNLRWMRPLHFRTLHIVKLSQAQLYQT